MAGDDWQKGLGWKLRLGLRFVKGDLMDFVKKLFADRPGLLRTVLAVYVLAVIVLHVLGLGGWAATLGSVFVFVGISPEAAGAPFSTEGLVAGVLAFAALLRPAVRWFLEKPAK